MFSTPTLMKLLAIRLGYQKTIAKSLVIALPLQGGGNLTPSPLRGKVGMGVETSSMNATF